MDPLVNILLSITGLRLVFEGVAVLVLTLAVLGAMAMIAALSYGTGRFRALPPSV